ncbi:MAG: hypothetical protein JWL87_531 [Candidatus Adlerbacteria bacterium]|nr:hypothetical protein [Candidatus Adlerbacteria bacterium]
MQSKIERQVMASVGLVYTTRRLLSYTALKVYALVASVYALGVLVWVERVQENFLHVMNGGVLAVGNFVLSAVAHTSAAVQLVLLVVMVAIFSLALDAARSVSGQRSIA